MMDWAKFYCRVSKFLCLLASKITIAAETETFNESILPCIGIMMFSVASSVHSRLNPVASVPTAMAEGFL